MFYLNIFKYVVKNIFNNLFFCVQENLALVSSYR